MKDTPEILDVVPMNQDLIYFNKVEAGLAILETDYAIVPDATTPEGKEEIRKGLAVMRPLRTAVDKRRLKAGKKLRLDLKELNDIGNRIIHRIRIVEDPYKAAKLAIEKIEAEAEAQRIAGIQERLHQLSNIFPDSEGATANILSATLDELTREPLGQDFAEFQNEAEAILADTLLKLQHRLHITKQAEEDAEIQRLEAIKLADDQAKLKLAQADATRVQEQANAKIAAEKLKADKLQKEAEKRIANIETEAAARIKKMEDDAIARIQKLGAQNGIIMEPEPKPEPKQADTIQAPAPVQQPMLRFGGQDDITIETPTPTPTPTPETIAELETPSNDDETSVSQFAKDELEAFGGEQVTLLSQDEIEARLRQDREKAEIEAPNPFTVLETAQSIMERDKEILAAVRKVTGMGLKVARNLLEAIKENQIPYVGIMSAPEVSNITFPNQGGL